MVVARASGMDLASILKRNTFLTLGVRPARGPGSARDGGPEKGPRDGGPQKGPRDGGTRGAPINGGQWHAPPHPPYWRGTPHGITMPLSRGSLHGYPPMQGPV